MCVGSRKVEEVDEEVLERGGREVGGVGRKRRKELNKVNKKVERAEVKEEEVQGVKEEVEKDKEV